MIGVFGDLANDFIRHLAHTKRKCKHKLDFTLAFGSYNLFLLYTNDRLEIELHDDTTDKWPRNAKRFTLDYYYDKTIKGVFYNIDFSHCNVDYDRNVLDAYAGLLAFTQESDIAGSSVYSIFAEECKKIFIKHHEFLECRVDIHDATDIYRFHVASSHVTNLEHIQYNAIGNTRKNISQSADKMTKYIKYAVDSVLSKFYPRVSANISKSEPSLNISNPELQDVKQLLSFPGFDCVRFEFKTSEHINVDELQQSLSSSDFDFVVLVSVTDGNYVFESINDDAIGSDGAFYNVFAIETRDYLKALMVQCSAGAGEEDVVCTSVYLYGTPKAIDVRSDKQGPKTFYKVESKKELDVIVKHLKTLFDAPPPNNSTFHYRFRYLFNENIVQVVEAHDKRFHIRFDLTQLMVCDDIHQEKSDDEAIEVHDKNCVDWFSMIDELGAHVYQERIMYKFDESRGGAKQMVFVLGRKRVVKKIGRTYMVLYLGRHIRLSEAIALDKEKMRQKRQRNKRG